MCFLKRVHRRGHLGEIKWNLKFPVYRRSFDIYSQELLRCEFGLNWRTCDVIFGCLQRNEDLHFSSTHDLTVSFFSWQFEHLWPVGHLSRQLPLWASMLSTCPFFCSISSFLAFSSSSLLLMYGSSGHNKSSLWGFVLWVLEDNGWHGSVLSNALFFKCHWNVSPWIKTTFSQVVINLSC